MAIEFRKFDESIAVYDKYTLVNVGHILKKNNKVVFEQLGFHGNFAIDSIEQILSKMKELQGERK